MAHGSQLMAQNKIIHFFSIMVWQKIFFCLILHSQMTHWVLPKRVKGEVAQLVEHRTENPCVGGSSPPFTTKNPLYVACKGFLFNRVSEWVSEKYFKFH